MSFVIQIKYYSKLISQSLISPLKQSISHSPSVNVTFARISGKQRGKVIFLLTGLKVSFLFS